jgi:hypothetical protein
MRGRSQHLLDEFLGNGIRFERPLRALAVQRVEEIHALLAR